MAGTSFTLTVTGKDQFNNGYDGTVALSASDGQTVTPGTATLVNGLATVTVTLDRTDPNQSNPTGTVALIASASSVSGQSAAIMVSPAALASLSVSAPNNATAGTAFTVSVTGTDPYGNGWDGTVTLVAGDGQTVSPGTLTLVNGSATVSVTLDGTEPNKNNPTGTLVLTASAASVSGASGSITVTSAAAASLSISAPGTVTAGTSFSVTVTGSDPYGNGYDGTVTLTAGDGQAVNPGTATLVNGSATVNVTLDRSDSGFSLVAMTGGVSASSNITVNSAAANHLSFSVQPGNTTAGMDLSPDVQVQVLDQYGNLLTTDNRDTVTVSISSGPGSFTSDSVTSVTVNGGVASFGSLKLITAGSYTLAATVPGISSGVISSSFAVSPAAADQLAFGQGGQPSNTIAGNLISNVQVMIEDQFKNVLTGDSTDMVTLEMFNQHTGQTVFAGGNETESVHAVDGVATFISLEVDRATAGGNPDDYLVPSATGGMSGAKSALFGISPAALASFAVSSNANSVNPAIVGEPFDVTIRARDAFGNTVSYAGPPAVTLSCSDGQSVAVAPNTIALRNGSATVEVTLYDTDGSVYLRAKAGSVTGTSNSFAINGDGGPGPSTLPYVYSGDFTFPNGSSPQLLGALMGALDDATAPPSFTVIAANDQQAQAYIQNQEIILEQQMGLQAGQISTGSVTKKTLDGTPLSDNLTDIQPVQGSGAPGTVASFALSFAGQDTADNLFEVTVAALDSNNNVVPGYTGTITLNSDDPQFGQPITYTFTPADQGIHSFYVFLDTADLESLTVTQTGTGQASGQAVASGQMGPLEDSALTMQQQVDVTSSSATNLVISAPTTNTAGSPTAITVTALDAFGNIVTGYADTVSLTNNVVSGITGLPQTYTFIPLKDQGSHTFDVTISTAENYAISASDPALGSTGPSIQLQITSSPAPAKLLITQQPSSTVAAGNGNNFDLTVEAVDSHGQPVSSFNGVVQLALGADPGKTSLGGAGGSSTRPPSLQAVNGKASFVGLTLDKVGAGYTIKASSGRLSATSRAFNVTPGTPSQLVVISQPPKKVTAGSSFSVKAEALDAYGNLASSFTGGVTLALAGGPAGAPLGGKLTATPVKGVATFTGLKITKAGTGYSLTASCGSLEPATTGLFSVTAATPTLLAVTTPPPASVTAGSAFGLVVTALDAYGNVATSFTGKVTLSLAINPAGSMLSGKVTVQAVAGVITFTDLLLNNAGTGYILKAKSGTLTVQTDAFSVVG
jgi:hypothetical protein